MNILVDINHPAHFHLFKNLIIAAREKGHEVIIAIRDKDVTKHLLLHAELPFIMLSKESPGYVGKTKELLVRDYAVWQLNRKYHFDMSIGTSAPIAHLTAIAGVPSYNFNEDDDYIGPLFEMLAYPFSTKIVVPDCMPVLRFGKKKVIHHSYHELAYLHPNNFTPEQVIVESYGLKPYNYVLIRKSALRAAHDAGAQGLSGDIWEKVQKALEGEQLILSHELDAKYSVKPWDMHHILAFAKLIVSDSQTMTAEAAVLGTPSVRYNSFVGRISYLNELEARFELTYGFVPRKDEEAMLEKIKFFLTEQGVRVEWEKRRAAMLAQKEDLNKWMIDYLKI